MLNYYRNLNAQDTYTYDSGSTERTIGYYSFPETEGKTFLSWNTQRDGSGTTYISGQYIAEGISLPTSLYAQWKTSEDVVVSDKYLSDTMNMIRANARRQYETITSSDLFSISQVYNKMVRYYPLLDGGKSITQNGIFDVEYYRRVIVSVSGGVGTDTIGRILNDGETWSITGLPEPPTDPIGINVFLFDENDTYSFFEAFSSDSSFPATYEANNTTFGTSLSGQVDVNTNNGTTNITYTNIDGASLAILLIWIGN